MSDRKIPHETLPEIAAMQEAGIPLTDLAKIYGFSARTLRNRLVLWSKAGGISAPLSLNERSAVQRLKDENAELRAKLRDADRYHGMVQELVKVVERKYEPLRPIDVRKTKPRKSQTDTDAFVFLADQHGDRIVQSSGVWGLDQYDFNVFRCRLWEWAKMIMRYTQHHLPNFFFDTLWGWHLGDSVQGDIHNMKYRNFFPNSTIAALAVGDVQAQALQWLAQFFNRINLVCVSGNHGRTTKLKDFEDPHDNFDYLVAAVMKARLTNVPNVQIIAPRAWSAFVKVRGHLFELNHGDGVRGTWSIPWYGFDKRESKVRAIAAAKQAFIDAHCYGHYHTPMTRPAGQGRSIHAGAWYITDQYALNAVQGANEPEQQLILTNERFLRQIEIPLMLRDVDRENAMRAGKWEPPFGRSTIVDELTPQGPVFEIPLIDP